MESDYQIFFLCFVVTYYVSSASLAEYTVIFEERILIYGG